MALSNAMQQLIRATVDFNGQLHIGGCQKIAKFTKLLYHLLPLSRKFFQNHFWKIIYKTFYAGGCHFHIEGTGEMPVTEQVNDSFRDGVISGFIGKRCRLLVDPAGGKRIYRKCSNQSVMCPSVCRLSRHESPPNRHSALWTGQGFVVWWLTNFVLGPTYRNPDSVSVLGPFLNG